MNIPDYLLKDFQPFDSKELLRNMKEKSKNQSFSHFAIIEKNGTFLGCISERDLATLETENKTIEDCQYLIHFFCAREENHWLELLHLFAKNEANFLPLIDKNQKYLGYLDLTDLLHFFSKTPFLNEEGTLLILEKETAQFSFSEVSQIVEVNNGKIAGFFVSKKTEEKTQISIKITSENTDEIIQTFRRYEYHITSNHKDDSYIESLKNRANYLQKYLNV